MQNSRIPLAPPNLYEGGKNMETHFCSAFPGEDWLGDQHCGHELGHPKNRENGWVGWVVSIF